MEHVKRRVARNGVERGTQAGSQVPVADLVSMVTGECDRSLDAMQGNKVSVGGMVKWCVARLKDEDKLL
jgi:hypothetical protein